MTTQLARGLRIQASAHYVPNRVVKNAELTQLMDTSDEWIQTRTGIRQRHVVIDENTSDLALHVATDLLGQSGLSAHRLDFIIVATMSPDYQTPSVAAQVQGELGATNAFAFDINAACSGFEYALKIANDLINSGSQRGIVIGAEVLSKLVDWHDRTTAVLFGDGAGGVLVEGVESNSRVLATDLATFGASGQKLTAGKMANGNAFGANQQAQPFFQMDGRAIYSFAVRQVPASIELTVAKANLMLADIDKFVLHQANGRIIERVAKGMDIAAIKFPTNVANYGNTSAASVPILFDELVKTGQITRGDTIALAGFGGGLTVGTIIIKY
ncbi:ketoacyl-ACP synthase III [Periweissella cryptocerci]|uniref:Beta-ketoacyl-[acyl-carrier-protein] synthase III n=1 Tax=Periweissella cryptocerci TaxID=2506420 RepID=A0A4P6YRD8_9LACO|nr:beta-ketoacyl-ACP synthase III [Periweissella cryptocerci]QBO35163.1 ketoacyl-ACP synthase III [Periweissella cryptocerci]